jgi:hypothetical protein
MAKTHPPGKVVSMLTDVFCPSNAALALDFILGAKPIEVSCSGMGMNINSLKIQLDHPPERDNLTRKVQLGSRM